MKTKSEKIVTLLSYCVWCDASLCLITWIYAPQLEVGRPTNGIVLHPNLNSSKPPCISVAINERHWIFSKPYHFGPISNVKFKKPCSFQLWSLRCQWRLAPRPPTMCTLTSSELVAYPRINCLRSGLTNEDSEKRTGRGMPVGECQWQQGRETAGERDTLTVTTR